MTEVGVTCMCMQDEPTSGLDARAAAIVMRAGAVTRPLTHASPPLHPFWQGDHAECVTWLS